MDHPEPQSQALALRPLRLAELKELGRTLVASKYFPTTTTMEQAVAKIKAGEELGIPPMAALQSIYFFDGKVTLSATLMGTLIQNSKRFSYRVRLKTAEECRIEFFEHGESLGIESFTIKEAQVAGLYPNKDNWKKYPKAMLFNRCMSNGAKTFCPAIFAGQIVYAPDELAPDVAINPDTGEIMDGTATTITDEAPPASTQQRVDLMRVFRQSGIREIAVWLTGNNLPPVAQMTAGQAEAALKLLELDAGTRQPPNPASAAPVAPEPVIELAR